METLEFLLHRHWGIRPARMHAMSSGHTNKTYVVDCDSHRSVLRVSWPGKSIEQVRREALVLDHLGATAKLPALPRFRPTTSAEPGVQTLDGSWLHLFEYIDGIPGLPADAESGTTDAMHTLARLHAAMATIPSPSNESSPITWLHERYTRVAGRAAPTLPADLPDRYDVLLDRLGASLDAATAWVNGPTHWLHGDYHAGNLLFVDGRVNGVLDFDDVGQGSHWLETAFALFALSRDATAEDRFVFDARLWDAGLLAYAAMQPHAVPQWMRENRDALMVLFCADQVLIHLEAAQRGLWMPGPGMGFLACWRRLLAGV